MKDKPKNIAASVRQRLLNARKGEQDFQRLLLRYAVERLLYRLCQSPLRDGFVLKGAMLFALWTDQPFRSTGDLDLLGFDSNETTALRKAFETICAQHVVDDGLTFDAKSGEARSDGAFRRVDQPPQGSLRSVGAIANLFIQESRTCPCHSQDV